MLGTLIYKSDQRNLLKSGTEKVNGIKTKTEWAGYWKQQYYTCFTSCTPALVHWIATEFTGIIPNFTMIWEKGDKGKQTKLIAFSVLFIWFLFSQTKTTFRSKLTVEPQNSFAWLVCLKTVWSFGIQRLRQLPLASTFLSPSGHYRNSGDFSHYYYRLINLAKPLQKSRKSSKSQSLGHKKNKARRRLITGCYFQCKCPSRKSPNFNNKAMHSYPSIPTCFSSLCQRRTHWAEM